MAEFAQEPTKEEEPQATAKKVSRRQMLMTFGIALNAVAGILFAIPIVGYIFGPSKRKAIRNESAWIPLGSLTQFPEGETRLATFRNPFVRRRADCGSAFRPLNCWLVTPNCVIRESPSRAWWWKGRPRWVM